MAGSGGNGSLSRHVRLWHEGLLGALREHPAEHLLERQDMGAVVRQPEGVAGARPSIGIESNAVAVVVAAERHAEPLEPDAIKLPSVAIRLLDLADDAG